MVSWFQRLFSYWGSGGPLLLPLAAVCFGIWALYLTSRQRWLAAMGEAEELDDAFARGVNPDGLTPDGTGLVAAVARAVRAIRSGTGPGAAFDREERKAVLPLRRDIVLLGALTTIAPLLGLLGTVVGMIETFDAVSATTGDTSMRVASGVSKALITTQFGLVIAIPGVFGMARLQRLARQVHVRWAMLRTRTLLLLESNLAPAAGRTA